MVKDLKKNDIFNRSEKMADAIITNDNRNFWREAGKINPKKKTITNTIDAVKENKNISKLFVDKYSIPYNVDAINRIKECAQQRATKT